MLHQLTFAFSLSMIYYLAGVSRFQEHIDRSNSAAWIRSLSCANNVQAQKRAAGYYILHKRAGRTITIREGRAGNQ